MKLIGIAGKAGSGKTTCADYLEEQHGWLQASFAGPLKEVLSSLGLPEPKDKQALLPGRTFSYREAIQTLGAWGRKLDPNFWVDKVQPGIEDDLRSYDVVVSDVRFENEAEMIRKLGGVVIHLHGKERDLGELASDVSERGIEQLLGDEILINGGRHEVLYRKLEQAIGDVPDRQVLVRKFYGIKEPNHGA